jgi:hypothetical protein
MEIIDKAFDFFNRFQPMAEAKKSSGLRSNPLTANPPEGGQATIPMSAGTRIMHFTRHSLKLLSNYIPLKRIIFYPKVMIL